LKAKKVRTEDYGFNLSDAGAPAAPAPSEKAKKKAEDYGFKLDP